MAWHQTGGKPLSEPLVSPSHSQWWPLCRTPFGVIRPQWVNLNKIWLLTHCCLGRHLFRLWFVTCLNIKQLPEQVTTYFQLSYWTLRTEINHVNIESKYNDFHSTYLIWEWCLQNGNHFVQAQCVKPIFSMIYWLLPHIIVCYINVIYTELCHVYKSNWYVA